ncbi:MAG: hypothetical protein ACXAC6_03125 [Candidatus Hodarchaeales archaeon]|jgi:hypothetical protein
MDKYEYMFWEPGKGFEVKQAEVFNEGNQFKFQPASEDQIKQTFEKEKVDPKTIRYAFLADKMVSYVQARIRDKSKEIHLSFPWAIPGTPVEVQDTLFDEMLSYVREHQKYSTYKIRVNAIAKPEENLAFLKKRGFVEKNVWKVLFLSHNTVSKASYDEKFTARVGTEEDIPLMINLIKEDGRYSEQFSEDELIIKYFKESVLATGHLILVFVKDDLLGATAPLIVKPSENEEERVILRFSAFKDAKTQEAFIPLVIEISKECIESGYGNDKPLVMYTDSMDSPREHQIFLEQFTPTKTEILMYYYYME